MSNWRCRPYATWFAGRDAVAAVLAEHVLKPGRWRLVPVRANDDAAFVIHHRTPDGWIAHGVQAIGIADSRVCRIIAFNDSTLVASFSQAGPRTAIGKLSASRRIEVDRTSSAGK